MPPTAVVFDLGKVLLDFDYGITVERLQKRCRVSLPELQSIINQSPLLLRYECSLLSTAQFFAEVQAASGFRGDLNEFRGMFADIFSPIPAMVQLHSDLRKRRVPTYIFSNTNELAIGHIGAKFPFFKDFDGYVLSFEHHAMKPDSKLYEVVEQVTGRHGLELLYIDDRPENVAVGEARGWQVILHHTPAETEAAVRKSGLFRDRPPERVPQLIRKSEV
jgi:HAD superfamily hydrolase (TIGR01509 family)